MPLRRGGWLMQYEINGIPALAIRSMDQPMVSRAVFASIVGFIQLLTDRMRAEITLTSEQRFILWLRLGMSGFEGGRLSACLGRETTFSEEAWQITPFQETGRLQFSDRFSLLGEWDVQVTDGTAVTILGLSGNSYELIAAMVGQMAATMPQ